MHTHTDCITPQAGPAHLQIGDHHIDGEEEEVRELFMATVLTARKGGYLAVSPDLAMFLSPSTTITLHIPGGFADEFNPTAVTERALRARSVRKL